MFDILDIRLGPKSDNYDKLIKKDKENKIDYRYCITFITKVKSLDILAFDEETVKLFNN